MSHISHHGVIGMKWGVRRYQNKDGTRTEAGKKLVKKYRSNAATADDHYQRAINRTQKAKDALLLIVTTDYGDYKLKKSVLKSINQSGKGEQNG